MKVMIHYFWSEVRFWRGQIDRRLVPRQHRFVVATLVMRRGHDYCLIKFLDYKNMFFVFCYPLHRGRCRSLSDAVYNYICDVKVGLKGISV